MYVEHQRPVGPLLPVHLIVGGVLPETQRSIKLSLEMYANQV